MSERKNIGALEVEVPNRWERFRRLFADKLRGLAWRVDFEVQNVLRITGAGEAMRTGPSPSLPRPDLEETELLCYGDCRCGWRMAAPEGALWPRCPHCGAQVLPPSPWKRKGQQRYGYFASLMPEGQAVAAVREIRRLGRRER